MRREYKQITNLQIENIKLKKELQKYKKLFGEIVDNPNQLTIPFDDIIN